MDYVSGLADKSNDFSNFLTVSRKFGYICLYIFHIIYPTKISQTKIFDIFPLLIQLGNILEILTNNCDRDTINYIPARDLRVNRLYFSLSNESKYSHCVKSVRIRSYSGPHLTAFRLNTKKYRVSPCVQSEYGKMRTRITPNTDTFHAVSCLNIDCRKSGPAKYRTNADNNFEQFCHFYQSKKDWLFNKFFAKTVEENNNSLVFQIGSVINVTKNGETKIYEAVPELKHLRKQNNGNSKSGDRQQIAEQSKFVDRK